MNILIASAEVTPLAKTGGLADVVSYLPIEWQKYGQNPIIILPKYSSIDTAFYNFKPTYLNLYVPMGEWIEFGHLWYGYLPGTHVPVFLIENHDYFNRSGIYGDPDGYPDNDRRFIFFCRAVFEAVKAINFYPDIIHAHDYHAAFTMPFLKTHYRNDPHFSKTAGVFTIHNLAYQGWFNPERAMYYSTFGIKEFYPGSWFEHKGAVNAMKVGIMFADKVTTVSPSYSFEIRSPEYGEGLQDVLNSKAGDLIGVLNGVDYNVWNPELDRYLFAQYSLKNMNIKKENKVQYLIDNNIDKEDNFDIPIFGIVTRLTEQKGIDILQPILESYLSSNTIRFAILGQGDQKNIDYFNYLAWKYPKNAFVYIGYSEELAHKIISCSDFLLMPSKFEPCGLTQMYALKYGTIPIVRSTGGLADTVREYLPDKAQGNGFVFWHYNSEDFAFAIRRALALYNNDPHWNIIRLNAMKENYSSSRSAHEYMKVFKWSLEKIHAI